MYAISKWQSLHHLLHDILQFYEMQFERARFSIVSILSVSDLLCTSFVQVDTLGSRVVVGAIAEPSAVQNVLTPLASTGPLCLHFIKLEVGWEQQFQEGWCMQLEVMVETFYFRYQASWLHSHTSLLLCAIWYIVLVCSIVLRK